MKRILYNYIFYIFIVVFILVNHDGYAIVEETNEQQLNLPQQCLEKEVEALPNQQHELFGYNLFHQNTISLSFTNSFFPEHYHLGYGDKLGIFLSGKIQKEFELVVNVEGKIYIPTVGAFVVSGMKMENFRSLLIKQISKFYDNFVVDVMLIEPKSVQIAVIGEVNLPGKYVLSALNTMIDAMILAGGPTKHGSLRNIQLFRNGENIATVDLYEFLTSPKKNDQGFLESGDRIFVPLMESKIQTSGELKRPMMYELNPAANERLTDIFEMAGGFTEYAYLDKIEISRLKPDGNRQVVYVNYHELIKNPDVPSNLILQNDDRIHVFSKLDQIHQRFVYIHGEVEKPGAFILEDGVRLSDLILKAGNLNRSAFMLEAEIAKIDPKTPARILKVNLDEIMNNQNSPQNIFLEEDDRVFIRQIPEWEVGPVVELKGELMFPGVYSITEDSTTLSEIIKKASGFTDEALIREAKLIRKSSKITIDKEYERLKLMTREQMSETEYQYLVMKENTQDLGQIIVDFYKLVIKNDHSEDVFLEDNDIIIVPKKPKVIYVTGRVSNPGGVLYIPDKKLKYYLEKAGGSTWDAQVNKTKVTKVSGEILDDEDVKQFNAGDIIWVPRKPDRNWWEIFRQTITVIAQIATVYIVIDRAMN